MISFADRYHGGCCDLILETKNGSKAHILLILHRFWKDCLINICIANISHLNMLWFLYFISEWWWKRSMDPNRGPVKLSFRFDSYAGLKSFTEAWQIHLLMLMSWLKMNQSIQNCFPIPVVCWMVIDNRSRSNGHGAVSGRFILNRYQFSIICWPDVAFHRI
jgi:hypothetical protein